MERCPAPGTLGKEESDSYHNKGAYLRNCSSRHQGGGGGWFIKFLKFQQSPKRKGDSLDR